MANPFFEAAEATRAEAIKRLGGEEVTIAACHELEDDRIGVT